MKAARPKQLSFVFADSPKGSKGAGASDESKARAYLLHIVRVSEHLDHRFRHRDQPFRERDHGAFRDVDHGFRDRDHPFRYGDQRCRDRDHAEA